MELVRQFFAALVSMTDTAIAAVFQSLEQENVLTSARLRAAVKKSEGNEFRRLKVALGYAVDHQLTLSIANIPFMTDEELVLAFLEATPDQRAEFVVALDEITDESGVRGQQVLSSVQERLNIEKAVAQRQAEEERLERELAKKAARRLELLEHTDRLILHILRTGDACDMTDELAVQYIEDQPLGYFKVLSDIAGLITPATAAEGEAALTGLDALRGGTIVDMLTGATLAVKDARSIRGCFITDEEGAKRLVKKLPKKEGGREIYRHLTGESPEGVLERLDRHDAEYAARQKRDEAFVAEVKKAIGEADATFVALAKAVAELVEINSVGTSGPEEWKMRIIRDISGEFGEFLRRSYIGQLRQAYPDASTIPALNARIEEVKAAWNQARATGAPSYEQDAILKEVHVLERHRQYLSEAPQLKPQQGKPTVGTHAHTKGKEGAPVLTDHSRDEDRERKERERRDADRKRTLDTKGKGGGQPQLTGKGKHQKGKK
ncbi:MAG: hypothetical protein A2294_00430 [Candidatus Magasanikbacteria bacterium RIFOXYB2_FULL_38_10]|nr:MAG: hypothetical protein A2294_00430 [Candidatus Magasanikbacteria bacterium RIFOXYB2_FULL_38_10]